ncbi:MAG TPA: ATP-binding protein [Pyrinomonadaceae bacterium]|nr:ATP-binding protein [Pyrinomonadaceae bacterium]
MREIKSIEIINEASVGACRRSVHEYARSLGFGETELGQIDIVVQEIGTNAMHYAIENRWLHFARAPGDSTGLELFYWDTGPGIYDVDRAIHDGVSTSGSLGAGLGTIRRMMDEFEIYSTVRKTGRLKPGSIRRTSHGTALMARKWLDAELTQTSGIESERFGVWTRPHPSEELNGDAYFIRRRGARYLVAVIDGLGHGGGAKEAADAALGVLDDWMGEPLEEVFHFTHNALRATRGAVMGAAIIDEDAGRFHYAGVGNVEARVFNVPEPLTALPVNGTLGARMGKVKVWTHTWTRGATLVMASDGLSAAWDMDSYPGLLSRSPQMLAGILMRDYARNADDATVLVTR